ncbi:MAG: hypothetical protein WD557_01340 [Dehalococcoidia bacterium]
MDLVVRLLIGIPIFAFVGGISFFLFNLLSGLVNLVSYGVARALRAMTGARGRWEFGGQIALLGTQLGKALSGGAFMLGLVLYCFLYPTWGGAANWLFAVAGAVLVFVWAPSVFFWGLFAPKAFIADDGRMYAPLDDGAA